VFQKRQMVRRIIKVTHLDATVRKKLRQIYDEDAEILIATGLMVATEFPTIAATNNYCR